MRLVYEVGIVRLVDRLQLTTVSIEASGFLGHCSVANWGWWELGNLLEGV